MDVIFGIMSPIFFEISLHGHLLLLLFYDNLRLEQEKTIEKE